MPLGHCTEAELLGWLDRELSWRQRIRCTAHLAACWPCRSRLAEIEKLIQKLGHTWAQNRTYRRPDAEAARQQFLDWAAKPEHDSRKAKCWRIPALARVPALAAGAALCALAVIGGLNLVPHPQQHDESAQPAQATAVPTVQMAPFEQPAVRLNPDAAIVTPRLETPAPAPHRSAEQAAAIELEVLLILHRLGACLGDPLEITATQDGHVLVRGVVASTARQFEITEALQRASGSRDLVLDLHSAEGARAMASAEAGLTGTAARDVRYSPLLERELLRLLRDPQRVNRFSHEAIRLAEAAVRQAWALRRLEERLENRGVEWPAGAAGQIQGISRDHQLLLANAVQLLRTHLDPVFTMRIQTPTAQSPPVNRFAAVERLHGAVLALFADSDAAPESYPQKIEEARLCLEFFENESSAQEGR